MDIFSFYKDHKIMDVLKKYIEKDKYDIDELFTKSIFDLENNECIISILGTQGSGKSSFLNAILFGDIVLPVDADETTCIPTLIKYGENATPIAKVYLKNGTNKAVECSERGLSDYVHQEHNPKNHKNVSYIEILIKHDLLKNGITFVDLPGVGSITNANQQVTMDFLKQSTASIFMLRTVPPITQSEGIFIQGALPLMGQVFWVQNQWTDESKEEVQDGKEHNLHVLYDIAQKINIAKEYITEPIVVCVKKALDGYILKDKTKVEKSEIDKFLNNVTKFVASWENDIKTYKKFQANEILQNSIAVAEEKKVLLSGDVEEELKKVRDEKSRKESVLFDNKKLVNDCIDELYLEKRNLYDFIGKCCKISGENLRNNVRTVIDEGVVSGEKLNTAFTDYLNEQNDELFKKIQPEFLKVLEKVVIKLQGLKDCSIEQTNVDINSDFSEKTKAHDFYGRLGVAGGGVGGIFAGIAAGAKVGALLGTSVAPGVGTAICTAAGIIVGACCTILGWFIGKKSHEYHLATQKEEAKRELFKYVEQFQNDIEKEYIKIFTETFKNLTTSMDEWLREQVNNIEMNYSKNINDINKPIEEKNNELKESEADIIYLKNLNKELI